MPTSVVLGLQWGDEGKGRIIDLLSEDADFIVRFQGGSNAGHTLIDSTGKQVILHLVPSGILWPDKTCVIGNGVVVEPAQLVKEITELEAQGYLKKDKQLIIADTCHLVMPYHRQLDKLEEEARGAGKIGTTGRGIGPAYMDKIGRNGIRIIDLLDEKRFRAQLSRALPLKQRLLTEFYKQEPIDEEALIKQHLEFGQKLKPYIRQVPPLLSKAIEDSKNILFEGAQGTELDIDHGTYPFVTSSNTIAGAATTGAGIGPKQIASVYGILKAYTTRVGSGPFPTEDHGGAGEQLCAQGKEFGATTGRKRRCGWLDIVQTKHAIAVSGIEQLILTKLDVLSGFDQVKICTGYNVGGEKLEWMPSSAYDLEDVEPIYEEFPGWSLSAEEIRTFDDLPKNARLFVRRIEQLLGLPIVMASVGPKRENFLSHSGKRFSPFV